MEKLLGTSFEETTKVTKENTALSVGSGSVEVFATPMMVALMEKAAAALVQPHLPEGYTTVGVEIQTSHIAATPVGDTVKAEAVLTETDGKSFTFTVKAYDGAGVIGEGTHKRVRVNSERFLQKANEKLGQV